MELTILKDQLVEKIRIVANTTQLVSDFYVLIESVPRNAVAARLATFKLSERIASVVPCTLLAAATRQSTLVMPGFINYSHLSQLEKENIILCVKNYFYSLCTIKISYECIAINKNINTLVLEYFNQHCKHHDINYVYYNTTGIIDIIYNMCLTILPTTRIRECTHIIALYNETNTLCNNIGLPIFEPLDLNATMSTIQLNPSLNFNYNHQSYWYIILSCIRKIPMDYSARIIQAGVPLLDAHMIKESDKAQAELTRQTTLQTQRNTAADTFNTRATAMITLLNPTIQNTITRQHIMLSKTDTLRNIRRGQDYTTHRNTTLGLIAEWWSANPRATPTAGDETFTNSAQETELFLEMCDIFDAENDTTIATGVFADRAHDFDSVVGITASLAASRISSASGVTNVTNVSRRSRASYASHPEAAQFFTR